MELLELLGMADEPKPMPGSIADLKRAAKFFIPDCLYARVDYLEDDFEAFDPAGSTSAKHTVAVNVDGGEVLVEFMWWASFQEWRPPLGEPLGVLVGNGAGFKYKWTDWPKAVKEAKEQGYKVNQ